MARVIGIDTSAEMLAVARRNLGALRINNVDLVEGDLATLPLGDDTVDAAFANMVLRLGFTDEQVRGFFADAGLQELTIEALGRQ